MGATKVEAVGVRPQGLWVGAAMPLVVGAIALGWWFGRAGSSKPPAAVATSDSAALARIERQLEQLDKEQRSQGSRLAAAEMRSNVASAPTLAQAPAATGDPGSRGSDGAPAPAPQPTPRQMYDGLERDFAGETVDRAWASTIESSLVVEAGKFKAAKLVSAVCRSTMCRMELRFPDREAREEFQSGINSAEVLMNKHVWTQRFTEEDGTLRSVMIIARGSTLPLPGLERSAPL